MIELTKKATPWAWTSATQQAFEVLKARMCSQPVLQQPDYTWQFHVVTDTSVYGYGAILCQKVNDDPKTKLHVIAFHSGTFTPME